MRTLASITDSVARQDRPTIVIAADPFGVEAIARIRSDLNCAIFPIPDVIALRKLNDKWQFANHCRSIGLPVPDTELLGAKEAVTFIKLADQFGYPFVLKPTKLHAGLGYRLISSTLEFDQLFRFDDTFAHTPTIAQRYVPGSDIDVSLLAIDGAIAHVAVQIAKNDEVKFVRCDELVAKAGLLVASLNYTGLLHIDCRVRRVHAKTGEIQLIEANPRPWGSMRAATWSGLDFAWAGISIALRLPTVEPAVLCSGSYSGLLKGIIGSTLGCFRGKLPSSHQRRLLLNQITDLNYLNRLYQSGHFYQRLVYSGQPPQ